MTESFFDDLTSTGWSAHLLNIVSNGNAIIAEVMRLSEMIPSTFRLLSKQDQLKYGELICDFSYFKNSDLFERKLEQNQHLQDLDVELKNNYLEILTRFFLAFESAHKYISDLNKFIEDLEDGYYIQQSIESVLGDEDGKQLLCEAIYIYGVILLTIDQKIDGQIRERLLVSFFRYSVQLNNSESKIEDICSLFRSTGYTGQRRPQNYPQDYFGRIRLNEQYLNLVISRLRVDDIYNQLAIYPQTEHRSSALANQAAMLYVTLFFAPDILHNQNSIMREMCDRFWPDNFVISVYMGQVVNLIDAWEHFRAAKTALTNTLEINNLKRVCASMQKMFASSHESLKKCLNENHLNEEFVLKNCDKLIKLCKQSNVVLRWILLHAYPNAQVEQTGPCMKRCKTARELVISEFKYDAVKVFNMLLCTSEYELQLKQHIKEILGRKEENWMKFKKETQELLEELVDVFSGNKPLSRVEKNETFEKWFRKFANETGNLDFNQLPIANRKVIKLIQAIEEVQEFQQLDSNLHLKQYLIDCKKMLHSMLQISNFKEETLFNLQIIADLSYAWNMIDHYTMFMQEGIKKYPKLVAKLRCTFLKLSSALDLPLVRINQANSPDLESVSQHYSSELVLYIRKVLQIIPATMFQLMERIIDLQTNRIKELPTKLDKYQLKLYSFPEERHEIARLTNSIAQFAQGLLMMKTILVGVIKVNSMKLLEDGIRKELVKQLSKALHNHLVFRNKPRELYERLHQLSQVIDGFKRSFEYIQDYLCIQGLKIFNEELFRVISLNVEQECNLYCRRKVMEFESIYQSKNIQIPVYPPIDNLSMNFIGRLAQEFIRLTDFKQTIYVYQMSAWYDNRTHAETLKNDVFKLLLETLGTTGLNGLDRVFGFMILERLKAIESECRTLFLDNNWSLSLNYLEECMVNDQNSLNKSYQQVLSKNQRYFNQLNDKIMRIGQLQILKMNIAHDLNTYCRVEAHSFCSAIENLNSALLLELKESGSKIGQFEDNALLYDLSSYLEWNGFSDTLSKIYDDLGQASLNEHYLIAFLIISQSSKFVYLKSVHSLTNRRANEGDGLPFVFGLLTWINQFSNSFNQNTLFSVLGGYLNTLQITGQPSANDLNEELVNLITLIDELAVHGDLSKEIIYSHINEFLFRHFRSL